MERKQFWFVLIILFLAVIADFLVTCKCYYGTDLTYVRSAYKCTIIENDIGLISAQFFHTLLPIFACMIASDIYYEEYSLGITNSLFTRCKKSKNIRCKLIAILIVVFSLTFGVLLLSLGLCAFTFPIQGHYSSNTTYLTLTTPEADRILSWLESFHPYLNLITFMAIRSAIAALLASFSFALSLFHKLNRYMILLSGFFYFIFYSNITNIFQNSFLNTDIMGMNTYGNIWAIFLFTLFLFVITICMTFIGERRETY